MLARLSRRQHGVKWLAGLVVLVAIAGCTPSSISVRPASDDLVANRYEDHGYAAVVRVPESQPGGLDVRLSCDRVVAHGKGDKKSVSLAIEVDIENRSESVTAGFDPRTATVTDARRQRMTLLQPASTSGSSDTTTSAIAPGSRKRFHLEFASRATGDPREVLPFTFRASVEYGSRELPVTVVFVREWWDEDYPYYPYYRYPYGYYGYGGAYGGGPGYWGPPGYWGWGPTFGAGYGWGGRW
jgi:hypothetical protein